MCVRMLYRMRDYGFRVTSDRDLRSLVGLTDLVFSAFPPIADLGPSLSLLGRFWLFESSMRDVIRGVSKSVGFSIDFCARYSMFSGSLVARSMLLLSRHTLDMGVNFFRIEYTAVVRSQRKLSLVRDSTFRLLGIFRSGVMCRCFVR